MAHTLPRAAHGDTLPIVAAKDKNEGTGDNRKKVGETFTALYLPDACAHIPITVLGADTGITQQVLNDRNVKLDFIKAKFTNLVITFTGGDYGKINYRGTADSVEILNLTPTVASNKEVNK